MTHHRERLRQLRLALVVFAAGAALYAVPFAVQRAYAQEPEPDRCEVTCARGTCSGTGSCTCTCSTFLGNPICSCSGGGGGGGDGGGEHQT